jgi:ATP-dependent Clp protease protease subunit
MNYNFGWSAGNLPSSRYVLPQFEERTPYGFKRQDPYTKLFEDRIIFLGVQVDDASADDVMAQLLVPGVHGPGPRHHPVHQLAGWLLHRHDGDLRHHAVHPPRDPDGLPRPGGQRRRGPAGGRHARQAPCAAERRVLIHQPALSGGQGGQASDLEIQAARSCGCASWLEDTLAQHSGRTSEQVNNDIERDKILTADEAQSSTA